MNPRRLAVDYLRDILDYAEKAVHFLEDIS